MHAEEMMSTHPCVTDTARSALAACIEACLDCAQTCGACADACLGEANVAELTQCIRLNQDCSDLCAATAMVASRQTGSNPGVVRRLLETCAEACRHCGDECASHAGHMAHCAVCAAACRACEATCRTAAAQLSLN